ncbi:MAG: FAD-dependent oxidoreductase [Bacteroidetes bacterium]|nr:MAG: FAD-dependent oxidoreductase [Bacteroidota bacterium]
MRLLSVPILRLAPLLLALSACLPTPTRPTEVLVIGGSTSGTTAAIQAARSGARTLLVTETAWLGGMLTAAGVSAIDGNHELPSGLWGEFRQGLYAHYGGPDSVSTGWVSHTLFEPQVGESILRDLAAAEPNLDILSGYRLAQMLREGNRITGAIFRDSSGAFLEVPATITVDATELGDGLALAGAAFFTGQDAPGNPHDPNIQDLTYALTVQDFGPGVDKTIPEPPGYDPAEFACLCREVCDDPERSVPDCATMLSYARLPGGRYMLNWPNNGNDYYVNPIPMSDAQRDSVYILAKNRSLAFLYFLQTEIGYTHLGLAEGVYPTADGLPLIPYHREARRVAGLVQLTVDDLIDPYADPARPLYQTAIAVGDYPLDHHHGKNPAAGEEAFPPIPSFSVPYEALVPINLDGLIVAEKSISVTHRVNGASRLQPCVMLIGQAAGAAAARCVAQGDHPRELPVRQLQKDLLEAGCWLLPYLDISPAHPFFVELQQAGVTGLLRGHGVPYKWANQTWIYPDSLALESDLARVLPDSLRAGLADAPLNRAEALRRLWQAAGSPDTTLAQPLPQDLDTELGPAFHWLASQTSPAPLLSSGRFRPEAPLNRGELAWLVSNTLAPFAHPVALTQVSPGGAVPDRMIQR